MPRKRAIGSPRPPGHPVFSSLRVQLAGAGNVDAIRRKVTRSGISGAKLREIRLRLGLTVEDIARILGAGERTVIRKEQGRIALSTAEADRAYRIVRIADLAIASIGDEHAAVAWLKSPNAYLGGEVPVAMLDSEVGTEMVEQSLSAIAYGGVA